jgi:hypothetical protein
MMATLAADYAIGIYYIIFFAPMLAIIAVLEGFFLFAYNYEISGGLFHNDFWFAVSWGALPLLAGYIIQTNSISLLPLAVACLTGVSSYSEIRISRPYKQLKRNNSDPARADRLENGLKAISLGTIASALSILIYRIIFS